METNSTQQVEAVEIRGARWFIRMGFAGFNLRANNGRGFETREAAIAAHKRCALARRRTA